MKQDEQKPIPVEILAASIKAIAEGVKKLHESPLNEKAIVMLIENATPAVYHGYKRISISAKVVRAVLDGMASLEREYLKPKKDAKK